MPDLTYPRIATILNETNVVSDIAHREGPPDRLDKRQEALNAFRYEHVSPDVRIGMVKLPSGEFAWPPGHQNEPPAVKQAREAKAAA